MNCPYCAKLVFWHEGGTKSMNTETKSADALARELAEEAADRCAFVSRTHKEFARAEAMTGVILRDAKLRELCAVAEALRLALPHIWPGEEKDLAKQALAALDGGGK